MPLPQYSVGQSKFIPIPTNEEGFAAEFKAQTTEMADRYL
jgi:hypothetical protein